MKRHGRHFIIYNPPITEPSLGLRKSSLLEGVRLAQDLLNQDVQSVVFARSRRSVEIILRYLQENQSLVSPQSAELPITNYSSSVRGYRSGYLPTQRREIERAYGRERSKPSLPRMHLNWESTSAGWARRSWSATRGPSLRPDSRRVGRDAGLNPQPQ